MAEAAIAEITEAPAPAAKKKEPLWKARNGALVLSPHQYGDFEITVEAECPFEQIIKPDYWSQVAHILDKRPMSPDPKRVGSIIRVYWDDHSQYCELYVLGVDRESIHVQCLTINGFNPKTGDPRYGPVKLGGGDHKAKAFTYRYNRSVNQWEVVRKRDLLVVANNLATKGEAIAWIKEAEG